MSFGAVIETYLFLNSSQTFMLHWIWWYRSFKGVE